MVILAVGISGIQQLGGAFYIEPLFNGVTLLIAIGLAGYAQRNAAGAPAQNGDQRKVRERPAPEHRQSDTRRFADLAAKMTTRGPENER